MPLIEEMVVTALQIGREVVGIGISNPSKGLLEKMVKKEKRIATRSARPPTEKTARRIMAL